MTTDDQGRTILDLIEEARGGEPEVLGRLLETHRKSLRIVAERQLQGRLAARLDASDVVQCTFLDAHRDFGHFVGRAEPELVAWLEAILLHHVALAIRDHKYTKKRDMRRERPLPTLGPDGDTTLAGPPDGHSSPSRRAIRGEIRERIEAALATLPPDQAEAVRLRHIEGWPLGQIAAHLDRSPTAVAGLVKRGLQGLRRTTDLRE